MLAAISDHGPRITETELQCLEQQLKVELPSEYKDFLVRYNGGRPVPSGFPVEGHPEKILPIQLFFGMGRSFESSCLTWNYTESRGRIPEELFPIGRSDTGDWICLCVAEEKRGQVFFWGMLEEMDRPTWDNVYWVADKFTNFLKILQDLVAPGCPLE